MITINDRLGWLVYMGRVICVCIFYAGLYVLKGWVGWVLRENRYCKWASRRLLKGFTEEALTVTVGIVFHCRTAKMVKANKRRLEQHSCWLNLQVWLRRPLWVGCGLHGELGLHGFTGVKKRIDEAGKVHACFQNKHFFPFCSTSTCFQGLFLEESALFQTQSPGCPC